MEVEANFMPYVREEENCGIGGVNPGIGYCRNEKFGCAIRSDVETEEVLAEQVALIPHFENFMKVVVE